MDRITDRIALHSLFLVMPAMVCYVGTRTPGVDVLLNALVTGSLLLLSQVIAACMVRK
jgi:hypothetical protein